jgi:serine protease Do
MKLKDLFVYFLIAIIAGLVAVYAYSRMIPPSVHEVTLRETKPAWFTTLPENFNPDQLDFTYAAERTVHGVVHVTTLRQRERQMDLFEYFFGPRGGQQQRQPIPETGIGSGVIISRDGYIVTNNHVIDGANTITVSLNDRRTYEAEVIGTYPASDLALLKIEEKDLPYVEFGDSDALRVGQWVLAVGNPMNLESTVTAGIVSAIGRGLRVFDAEFPIESFIQTDAAVNRGNSGGALVNLSGQLVGIPTLILSPTGAHAGNAFAIPSSIVRKVVEDLMEFGEVQRAVLGVQIRDVNAELAREEGLDRIEGVYVAEAMEGGAAAAAGIRQGDVILSVNGMRVNSVARLQELVARNRPGDKVDLVVRRNGRTREVTATLRNVEGRTDLVKPQEAFLGATFREVSQDLRKKLNIDHGVQITSLAPGPFRSARIRDNFIILSINNQRVSSPSDIRRILEGHEGGVYIEGVYPDGTSNYYAFGL